MFTELGRFGQATASATHVNNAGTVLVHTVDAGEPSALLFRDGLETPLGIGRPWDINDADVVVAGTDRVQVYVGSTWTTLAVGTVKGIAVNNLGQIVGSVSNQLKRWTPVPTSALVVSPVSAFDDDEITLTAALTSQGAPVAGQQIVFSLAGSVVGSGTTGPDGVATLTGVFSGLPIGVQPEGVRASFAGLSRARRFHGDRPAHDPGHRPGGSGRLGGHCDAVGSRRHATSRSTYWSRTSVRATRRS